MTRQPTTGTRALSPREQEVVARAGEGLSNKEIALALGITPETVETHLKRARSKLGAATRRDAARIARETSVPTGEGHQPLGIAGDAPVRFSGPAAALPNTEHAAGRSPSLVQRVLKGSSSSLDRTGLVGRLLWVSGVAVLAGLLAIGLLVAADGFALVVHNLAATGHPR